MADFIVIQQGTLYDPEPGGAQDVLICGERILKVGPVNPGLLEALGLTVEVIDARGCLVMPGFIDPHAHIIGGGGEHGFASRMPELQVSDIVQSGVTTVVGLLGTDTTTRHLTSLHSKVNQLVEEGLSAYFYTGGFQLPPQTITGSIMDDVVIIDRILGAGEIALSDYRWVDPPLRELSMAVKEAMVGGMMAKKAGVTHLHIGEGERRLALLHQMLDEYDTPARHIHATHITRSPALMDDAIALAQRGAFVDMDTIEGELGQFLRYYLEHGGPPEQLTVSSDAHTPGGSPRQHYLQFVRSVREFGLPLELVLKFYTSNAANVLQLESKGAIRAGKDADVLVLRAGSLEVEHLLARGRLFIRDGQLVERSKEEDQVDESHPQG